MGDETAARAVLGKLESLTNEKRDSFSEALIYTALGDTDRAFKRLQQACEEHNYWITTVKTDPRFNDLRSDPRYADLLRRMGLPQ